MLRQAMLGGYGVKETMKQGVPTYHDPAEVNEKANTNEEMHLAGCVNMFYRATNLDTRRIL